jgi:hypothetical protein
MQDAVAVKRQVDDDRVSGRGFAQPLDAEFAELDALQRGKSIANALHCELRHTGVSAAHRSGRTGRRSACVTRTGKGGRLVHDPG